MVLLDFIGQRGLRLRADASADSDLWAKVRKAGRRAGVGQVFPPVNRAPSRTTTRPSCAAACRRWT